MRKSVGIAAGASILFLASMMMAGNMLSPSPQPGTAHGATQIWSLETSSTISATQNGLTAYPTPLCLHWIMGVFTGAATNPLTLSVDSNLGANWDTIIYVIPGTSTTDFFKAPDAGALCLGEGDQLVVNWVEPGVVRANLTMGLSW